LLYPRKRTFAVHKHMSAWAESGIANLNGIKLNKYGRHSHAQGGELENLATHLVCKYALLL